MFLCAQMISEHGRCCAAMYLVACGDMLAITVYVIIQQTTLDTSLLRRDTRAFIKFTFLLFRKLHPLQNYLHDLRSEESVNARLNMFTA